MSPARLADLREEDEAGSAKRRIDHTPRDIACREIVYCDRDRDSDKHRDYEHDVFAYDQGDLYKAYNPLNSFQLSPLHVIIWTTEVLTVASI